MIINKYKFCFFYLLMLTPLIFTFEVFSQSSAFIDIDKSIVFQLPENLAKENNPESVLKFNDVVDINNKRRISFDEDNISPIIKAGKVFLNADKNMSVYDLETANEITSVNKSFHSQYKIVELEKKKKHQSLLGTSYSVIDYMVSIDQKSGDTLWEKQLNYETVYPGMNVSLVGNNIIDNKTGKGLYKLISTKPLSFSEIKEDGDIMYLRVYGSLENELIAINIKLGKVIWRVKGKFNGFFIDKNRIYTSNQCSIDKKTGKLIWSNISNIWIEGIVGDYLIGSLFTGEDDPELYLYNKKTGELAGCYWWNNEFCMECLGFESCGPQFTFAKQGEGNKTAALITCKDGVYLYTFEVKENK